MFEHGTVFVVGAGGSHELGLPTGETLMTKIGDCLAIDENDPHKFVDKAIARAAINIARSRAHYYEPELDILVAAAERLRRALPFALSIDNLLDAHRDDGDLVTLGKLGIARAILLAEHESNLRSFIIGKPSMTEAPSAFREKLTNLRNSWYPLLMRLLNAGLPLDQLSEIFSNVSFVTFNYDRCIEYYLYHGLQRYYSVTEREAAAVMETVQIVHIYGSLGRMPWEGASNNVVPFGSLEHGHLPVSANRIKTFTEVIASKIQSRANIIVSGAQTLVLMGFGFLPQNIEVLRCETDVIKRVFFATTYGIGDGDVELVRGEIRDMLPPADKTQYLRDYELPVYIERKSCAELMRNNWVRLTR